MKHFILLLCGLIPFPLGWLANRLILNFSVWWIRWYAVIILVIWFFLAYGFSRFFKSIPQVIFLLNLPAAIVLLLLTTQQFTFHPYWMNAAGLWTQLFYLPLISLSAGLTAWTHHMIVTYCAAFVLLLAASLLGCIARGRRIRRTQRH